jgi:hypothetical protein
MMKQTFQYMKPKNIRKLIKITFDNKTEKYPIVKIYIYDLLVTEILYEKILMPSMYYFQVYSVILKNNYKYFTGIEVSDIINWSNEFLENKGYVIEDNKYYSIYEIGVE